MQIANNTSAAVEFGRLGNSKKYPNRGWTLPLEPWLKTQSRAKYQLVIPVVVT
jgi:hypothetical protein